MQLSWPKLRKMPKISRKENILQSWKEISNYLGCDRRTCQRWEKRFNLPVRRLGENISTVFAYKDEIDLWLKQKTKTELKNPETKSFKLKYAVILFFILLAASISLSLILDFSRNNNGNPADFRIDNSRLIILNRNGRDLWTFDTGLKDLRDEQSYRDHFQKKKKSLRQKPWLPFQHTQILLPHIIISDLENDGKSEVLFSYQTKNDRGDAQLICFDYDGSIRWKKRMGGNIDYGKTSISNDYYIFGMDTLDTDGDGTNEILGIAYHILFEPTQVLLLDHEGKKLGEYWNAGRIEDYVLADLDGRGAKNIVLAGMNNEYGKGCLIVLDAANVNGASPQSQEDYVFHKKQEGIEKQYILFPRTDADRHLYDYECMNDLYVLENKSLAVCSKLSHLYFILGFDLRIKEVESTNKFEKLYDQSFKEGKVESVLDRVFLTELKNGLLYHDKNEWISSPKKGN